MKNPFVSNNTKQVNLAHAEAKKFDDRAAILVKKLGAVRSELSLVKENGARSSAPLSWDLADFLYGFARDQLNAAATAYRAGDSLTHGLDIADWALQMASGLTGGRKAVHTIPPALAFTAWSYGSASRNCRCGTGC